MASVHDASYCIRLHHPSNCIKNWLNVRRIHLRSGLRRCSMSKYVQMTPRRKSVATALDKEGLSSRYIAKRIMLWISSLRLPYPLVNGLGDAIFFLRIIFLMTSYLEKLYDLLWWWVLLIKCTIQLHGLNSIISTAFFLIVF